MAKKTLLDTISPRPTAEELDRLAEQIHQSPTNNTNNTKSAAQPAARKVTTAAATAPPPPAKKNTGPVAADQHRLTIDLPRWLVEAIRTEGKKNGITVRGMILAALLEKYQP